MSTSGPKCPNHAVPLLDCHDGLGICPISGCQFTYTGNEEDQKRKLRVNSLGLLEEEIDYGVKQVDGNNG